MGALLEQKSVKMVVSIIYREDSFLYEAETTLVEKYGEIEDLKEIFYFDFTDYYEKEFGKDLKRKLICFKKPIGPEFLSKIKHYTNEVEKKLKNNNNRTVNIDPGYITEAKLVLFTTKDYSHRVYIGDNIFAEVTLHFQNNSFRAWPWTYPDYSSNALVDYFNKVRSLYMRDIKKNSI